jgi:hypothetical protein
LLPAFWELGQEQLWAGVQRALGDLKQQLLLAEWFHELQISEQSLELFD